MRRSTPLLPTLLVALAACASGPSGGPPEGFELVYGQDFEGDAWCVDFGASDPAAWGPGTVDGNGTAALRGPALRAGPWGSPGDFLWLDGVVLGDFVLEFDVLVPEGGASEVDVYLAAESPERFVYASLAPRATERTHDVFRVDHAAPLAISRSRTFGVALTPGVWHHVVVARSTLVGRVTVAFGDEGVALTAGNGALAEGWIGFGARGGAAHFDHLRVWAPEFSMRALDGLAPPAQSRR